VLKRTRNFLRSYQEAGVNRQSAEKPRNQQQQLKPRHSQQLTQRERPKCYSCGKRGHTARKCRFKYTEQQGQPQNSNQGAQKQECQITNQTQDYQNPNTAKNGSINQPFLAKLSQRSQIVRNSPTTPVQGKFSSPITS